MNPFDFSGPSFLLFYLLVGVTGAVVVYMAIRSSESQKKSFPEEFRTDPYSIAYLRSGSAEALRIATVSLMDRGLLRSKGNGNVARARTDAASFVKRPIEKAVLDFFNTERVGYTIASSTIDKKLVSCCNDYESKLKDAGLICNDAIKRTKVRFVLPYMVIMVSLSIIKTFIALNRGHFNLYFLIILTIVFYVAADRMLNARLTASGKDLLSKLRSKFTFLKARAETLHSGGETNDLSFIAAVYGLSVIPALEFPYIKDVFPRAATASTSSSSGGCGGGCSGGSSGGGSDSGGGGCGGGGCGGGCGGCG